MIVRIPREVINDDLYTVSRLHVSEGAEVIPSLALASIETSKRTFDILSPASGVIHWLVNEGDQVAPLTELCEIK